MNKNIQINPFNDNIVKEPREIDSVISGLNDAPLSNIIERFEFLEKGKLPRRRNSPHARFIVSSQPGYGKTHLIGRLFKKLKNRATLIYLVAFEDPSTCWKNILLKMVQEMEFPDSGDSEYSIDEPTQLEAFSHGVLSNLMADGIESGDIPVKGGDKTSQNLSQNLRKTPLAVLRRTQKALSSIQNSRNGLINRFIKMLHKSNINLNASPISWLSILFNLAYRPDDFIMIENCKDWLKGGSIDADVAKAIGIQPIDIPNPEMPSNELNQLCRLRVQDFCKLAGFFRPFVICFDQTENYSKDNTLASKFGSVVLSLIDECRNHLTLITANSEVWKNCISVNWQPAQTDRLSNPIELEGINKEQAKQLIEMRFKIWAPDKESIRNFLKDGWLEDIYQLSSEYGVRAFLNLCNEHWQNIKESKPGKETIKDYFNKNIEKIRSLTKRHVFEPDIFYWFVNEACMVLPGLKIKKTDANTGHFSLYWETGERRIYFGFEEGSHWKRWAAIMNEAGEILKDNAHSKFVFFRTPELSNIPGSKWEIADSIEKAKKDFLHIINLNLDELIDIYASHELYMDSMGNDIPFDSGQVRDFIGNELVKFRNKILMNSPEEDNQKTSEDFKEEINEALIDEIRSIVSKEKLITLENLKNKLALKVSDEQIHRARGYIREIKVYQNKNEMVLTWVKNK